MTDLEMFKLDLILRIVLIESALLCLFVIRLMMKITYKYTAFRCVFFLVVFNNGPYFQMRVYYSTFTDLLRVNVYDLYKHVTEISLTPDLYLVDWIYTLFSKSMNLDLACRIWDLIVRDGEVFIFRAALGNLIFYIILHSSTSDTFIFFSTLFLKCQLIEVIFYRNHEFVQK